MANIALCLDEVVNDERVISVESASATLDDGNLVIADTLVTGQRDVYTAAQATANTDDNLAIVVGADVYQTAEGDRIPIKDPTRVTYPQGSRPRAYKPAVNQHFKISTSAVTSASRSLAIVGNFLIPTANSYELTAIASVPASVTLAFKIEQVENFSVGIEEEAAVIARCTIGY